MIDHSSAFSTIVPLRLVTKRGLTRRCQDNNLLLNVSKIKKLIVDIRKNSRRNCSPLNIIGSSWRGWTASNMKACPLTAVRKER